MAAHAHPGAGTAPRPQDLGRTCAVLFLAASLVTAAGLLLPHQPQVNELGLAMVAAVAALAGAVLVVAHDRLPVAAYHAAVAVGTVEVSLALLFNGERDGGRAGGDEMFYLWVALAAAYYLPRLGTAVQVALISAAYAVTLVAIDPGPVAVSRWLSLTGLVVGAAVVVRLLRERGDRLLAALEVAARTDPLTGLDNRRAFDEAFGRELARVRRSGGTCSLVLGDLDRFKELNDRLGHAAGDDALRAVGAALLAEVRGSDRAARLGGDEFALLLADTGADGARGVAERVRAALRSLDLELSFGVAEHGVDGRSLDELVRAADAELYARKRAARI